MKKQIVGYGFEYSFGSFVKKTILVVSGILFFGKLYGLRWQCMSVIGIAVILTLPTIIASQFQYVYEQQKFSDVVSYLEQMIYAFKKKPKVLNALRDTQEIMTGDIKETVAKSILYLEKGVYQTNLYRESFERIEKEYACERMYALHSFLEEVEIKGGEFQGSIDILLEDIKSWTARVYQFQKQRKLIKNNITFAIGLALFICFATTKMFPEEFSIKSNWIYQITTTVVMILFLWLYVLVQTKMNGSWLKKDVVNEKRIQKDYQMVEQTKERTMRIRFMPMFALLGVFLCCGIMIKKNLVTAGSILGIYLLWTQPKRSVKAAKKRLAREIEKAFPIWMRNLSLSMQRENIAVAIENSFATAPFVLKNPLQQLIEALREDVVSIKPYTHFLEEYDIPEISSSMKMLYSLNMMGKEEIVKQVDTLIERNTKLLDQAEKLREEDTTAITGFLVAAPMVISLGKLVVDLMLMIFTFLQVFSYSNVM